MKVKQRHFWFNEPHDKPLPKRAIFVDGFAGGGGASVGIARALGRDVDVAINHDASAIAMHMANHPGTKHYCENLWDIDPVDACEGREVDGAWFSPDCTHFSKARGEKPVSKNIRGLAWVVVRWAELVKPRVMFVENVEEFLFWGPVDRKTNKPIKAKAGVTFELWLEKLKELGYDVEWRVLSASDYGTPTTRKRLFIVARCDGKPIVWPEPTHGGPKQVAREFKTQGFSRRQKWRTAADIIDWSIECPSIFLTPAEAKARGCKRPLAEKTMRRIAEGIRRYVIETSDPFIVTVNHGGDEFRGQAMGRPLPTLTQKLGSAVVCPTLVQTGYGERDGQRPRCLDLHHPLGTVVAGGSKHAVVSPYIVRANYGSEHFRGQPTTRALATVVGSNTFACIAPTLVSYYGPRPGDNGHRGRTLQDPLATQTVENRFGLVTSYISRFYGASVGHWADDALATATGQNKSALVSAWIAKHYGGMVGVDARTPFPTVTARGTQNQVVSAHVTKMNYGVKPCTGADEPLHTIVAGGQTHALTTSHLMKLRGTCRHGQPVDEPAPSITSGGNHVAEVRAFLMRYYSSGGQWSAVNRPLPTITSKDRLCLGIVMVGGEPWQIVDIGMRMLTPRELFNAQGFPSDYDIDTGLNGKPATKKEQVARCGNSVCPQVVESLVRSNLLSPNRT